MKTDYVKIKANSKANKHNHINNNKIANNKKHHILKAYFTQK